jgi:5,10-methylenetetrahydromethanopterin reductase
VQVDIRVPVGAPLPRLADFIARCEDEGFDGVGVHDHPHAGRDVYMALALAAQRTGRIRLYPATSSPYVRHPLVLASLAHSLEEIAPRRISLTVAPGFLSVRSVGRPRASVAAMREAVVALRGLLAGQSAVYESTEMRMRNVSETPTPVYLLAAGPRMVELAGEVADGALLFVGLHPEAIASARRHLEVGAKRANRSLKAFRTIFAVSIALDDTAAAAQRWIQSWFAPGQPWLCYPSASNLHWLRAAGFDLPDPLQPEAIAADEAARIADAFGLFGPPERCAERLVQAHEISAVEHVFLFPAHTLEGGYELPVGEVEAFGRVMRPQLVTR